MNKNSKGLTTILILILLLALGAAGFFAYQNYQLKPPIPQYIQTTPTPTPNPTALQVPDGNLANWEPYTDPEGRFSFKYPPDPFHNQPTTGNQLGTDRITFSSSSSPVLTTKSIYLNVDIYPKGTVPYDIDTKEYYSGKDNPSIILGLNRWILVNPEPTTIKENGRTLYARLALTKTTSAIYQISLTTVDDKKAWENNINLFTQILSTFEFID